MISGAEFLRLLVASGFDFFTGVPCSLAKSLIAMLEERGGYIAETREDAAVGLAAGAYMAGKQPVVIMQNSGLGVCVNALASLSLMYDFPCLLFITWRGYQGKDAPEHLIMGDISPRCSPHSKFPTKCWRTIPFPMPSAGQQRRSSTRASRWRCSYHRG
jgi:sulfopyruvate decarboxylase subunit alpha